MKRAACLFALAAPILSPIYSQISTSDPEYRKLRDAQPSESFAVENVTLRRDTGILTLKRGTVSFVPAVLGRVTIGVFQGEGEFALTPAVGDERNQLKSAIGDETARDTFDRALLYFTDGTYEEIRRMGRPAAVPAGAAGAMRESRERLRRLTPEDTEAQVLADLHNPKRAGFFTAYLHGRKYSDLRFFARPRGATLDLGPAIARTNAHLDALSYN